MSINTQIDSDTIDMENAHSSRMTRMFREEQERRQRAHDHSAQRRERRKERQAQAAEAPTTPATPTGIVVGQTYPGVVVRVLETGVFVRLGDSEQVGLVHVSRLVQPYVEDARTVVRLGEAFPVKVLSCNAHGQFSVSAKDAEGAIAPTPSTSPAETVPAPRRSRWSFWK